MAGETQTLSFKANHDKLKQEQILLAIMVFSFLQENKTNVTTQTYL